jgi:pimeloyl-ACP methyl ester carboxylesterase
MAMPTCCASALTDASASRSVRDEADHGIIGAAQGLRPNRHGSKPLRGSSSGRPGDCITASNKTFSTTTSVCEVTRAVGVTPNAAYRHFADRAALVLTVAARAQQQLALTMPDQHAGRRLVMPTLAMWQDPGDTPLPFDPEQIWRSWAAVLRTEVLSCGHFLPEEQPDHVAAAIGDLLAQ